MDTIAKILRENKKYFDQDENPCTLEQMIEREPEWVASRFRHMEEQIEDLQTRINSALSAIKEQLGDAPLDYIKTQMGNKS